MINNLLLNDGSMIRWQLDGMDDSVLDKIIDSEPEPEP